MKANRLFPLLVLLTALIHTAAPAIADDAEQERQLVGDWLIGGTDPVVLNENGVMKSFNREARWEVKDGVLHTHEKDDRNHDYYKILSLSETELVIQDMYHGRHKSSWIRYLEREEGPLRLAEVISVIRFNRKLDPSRIKALTASEIRIARNAVFARHGRSFKSPELGCYFHSRNWYSPDKNYADSRLTSVDRANVGLLLKAAGNPEPPDTSTADGAMRRFLDAVFRGDADDFLALCHPEQPFKMLAFEIGSLEKIGETKFTKAKLKKEFDSKAWQYDNLLGPLQQAYHLRIPLVSTDIDDWRPDDSGTFHGADDTAKGFVSWQKIDGKWYLAAIADTLP